MRPATLRMIGIIAAALLLGTVALAVAVGAQSPKASQIPTVVTNQPTGSPVVPSLVPTHAAEPSVALTSTIARPAEPQPKPARTPGPAQIRPASTSSDREVVTPAVRDDGDDDDDDHDSDDEGDRKSSGDGDSDRKGSSGEGKDEGDGEGH